MSQIKALTVQQNNKTLLCTAVGSGSYQSVLEAFTGFGRAGNILKHDKAVIDLSVLDWLVKRYIIHYPWINQMYRIMVLTNAHKFVEISLYTQ